MKKLILSAAIAAALCANVAKASDDNEGGNPLVGTSSTVNSTVTGNNTNSLSGVNTNNNSLSGVNTNNNNLTNNNAIDNNNTLSNVNNVANRNNNWVNSSNANTSRNDNVNTLDQSQRQGQDQLQYQDQHQVANGGNSVSNAQGGNSVATAQGGNATGGNSNSSSSANGNGSGNVTNITDNYRERLQVSSAFAPYLTSGVDTCLGSITGGVQTQILGVSAGKTVVDENCVKIKNDRERMNKAAFARNTLGSEVLACYIVRQDPDFDAAYKAAGIECSEPTPVRTEDVPIPSAPPTAAITVVPPQPQIIKEVIREIIIHPNPPPQVITKIKYKNKCPKQPTIITKIEKKH